MNHNILILCEGIWSLSKNAGVTSLKRLIDSINLENHITLFIPQKEDVDCYSMKALNIRSYNVKNRYLSCALDVKKWLYTNFMFVIYGLHLNEKPDLIYISSDLPSVAGYILSRYYNVPYVQRQYGTFLRKKLGSFVAKLKSFREVISYMLPANAFVITDDGTYGDEVAAYYNIPDERVFFWRNGVDKPLLDNKNIVREDIRRAYGIKSNDIIVMSVSRLVNWKRVDRIIKAFNGIDRKNVYYFVIGDGAERENLESLSINDNCIFVGAIPNDKVREYMLACDIFVSMYDLTNLGNPLLEALSSGMPIITLDTGNTSSVFDGQNMIILPVSGESKIVDNLRDTMIELIDNPRKRNLLSENAATYAEKNIPSWEERIDREKCLILKLIDDSN